MKFTEKLKQLKPRASCADRRFLYGALPAIIEALEAAEATRGWHQATHTQAAVEMLHRKLRALDALVEGK